MKNKTIWAVVMAAVSVLCFCACTGTPQTAGSASASPAVSESGTGADETTEVTLIVFAAASMQETLDEISGMYDDVDPDVRLVFNFDSSGTLQTQIEEGADCDVFISAAQKQMDALEEENLIDTNTRIDLLENKVTLAVPEGNPAQITGFRDLKERFEGGSLLMAVGNSDVPVGQYTEKIFEFMGLDEADLAERGELTYGTNVKEVTTQISEASVDCGIIYATDAFSAGLEVVDEATAEMCGQVIYPAAVLEGSTHKEAAEAFLAYLQTQPAISVFESVGFSAAQ